MRSIIHDNLARIISFSSSGPSNASFLYGVLSSAALVTLSDFPSTCPSQAPFRLRIIKLRQVSPHGQASRDSEYSSDTAIIKARKFLLDDGFGFVYSVVEIYGTEPLQMIISCARVPNNFAPYQKLIGLNNKARNVDKNSDFLLSNYEWEMASSSPIYNSWAFRWEIRLFAITLSLGKY